MSEPYTTNDSNSLEEDIGDAIHQAEDLEQRILAIARRAGQSAVGRQLNIAATQVGLGAGMLLRAGYESVKIKN